MSETVVLKLAKHTLWVYKIGPEGLGEFSETEWKKDNLEQLLQTIKVKFKTTKVRVILADEVSYNLEFKWPKKGEKPSREMVKAELEGRVPDEVGEDNWDYDLIKQDDESYLVRVFMPVEDTFEIFRKICKLVGLRVMLVIPEKFLGEGDDQMLKIAKMKIGDRDEAFLGMTPEAEESILNKEISFGSEKKKPEGGESKVSEVGIKGGGTRKVVVVGGIVVIVSLLVLLGWLVQQRKNRKPKVYGSKPSPSPTVVVKKKEASSAATKPQKEASSSGKPKSKKAIDLSKYKVVIKNGSGIAGEAGRVGEILKDEGFEKIETGNADRFDYQKTRVELKKGLPDGVKTTIDRALNDRYVLEFKELQKENDYDVLIIVGKLFVQEKGGEK